MAEKQFKVDIDSDIADGVNGFADDLGMKNKAVVERLFRYFLSQPSAVRKHMIGLIGGDEAAAIRDHAQSLPGYVDFGKGNAPPDDAAGGSLAKLGPDKPKPTLAPGSVKYHRSAALNRTPRPSKKHQGGKPPESRG